MILFTALTIISSLIFKKIFEELYPLIDAICYGRIYEGKIQSRLPVNPFWTWLFKTYPKFFGFKNAVPRYRVFQKSILISYWLIVYLLVFVSLPLWLFAADCVLGLLWAFYWMRFERRYYYYAKQEKQMYEYEQKNEDVFWLKRIYFSGKWLFKKGFKGWKFDLSSTIGVIGLYVTSVAILIYFLTKGV